MLNKKILLGAVTSIATVIVASNSYAAAPGFYLGGQLGWGKIHQSGISGSDLSTALAGNNFTTSSFSNSSKDSGIAGRLFGGYQFDENWAAEMGWTRFHNMTTSATASATNLNTGSAATVNASGTIKTNAIDLVGKYSYPIQENFSIYGKAGVAYLNEKATANASITELGFTAGGTSSKTEHKIFPTFGVGAAYDITPNVVADVSWNRIQKTGSSDLHSTDLISGGLSYHFG